MVFHALNIAALIDGLESDPLERSSSNGYKGHLLHFYQEAAVSTVASRLNSALDTQPPLPLLLCVYVCISSPTSNYIHLRSPAFVHLHSHR